MADIFSISAYLCFITISSSVLFPPLELLPQGFQLLYFGVALVATGAGKFAVSG